jgi:predicted RND superfamily exporter protein
VNESARQIAARIRSQRRSTATNAAQAARDARRIAAAQGLSPAEQRRLARRARELAYLNSLQPAIRYGLSSRGPQVIDSNFVHQLVFDARLGFEVPKTRFAHLFPNRSTARIELLPRAGLSRSQLRSATDLVRSAVADPSFRLDSATYLVSGLPIASEAVASHVSESVIGIGVAALLALAVVLVALLRIPHWWRPLLAVVLAAIVAFGVLSLTGGSLTLASIALVPLTGALALGWTAGPPGRRNEGVGWERLLGAAAVTLVALLSFLLSPAPMIRILGLLVALAFVLTLLFDRLLARLVPAGQGGGRGRAASRRAGRLAPVRDLARRSLSVVAQRPAWVVAVGALVAILGWALQGHIGTASSLDRIAPDDLGAVKDLDRAQRATLTGSDAAILVRAKDVTAPGVLSWMSRYEQRVLARHGYTERRPCQAAELCPAASLVSLLGRVPRDATEARAVVRQLPASFSRGVLSRDHRTALVMFDVNDAGQKQEDEVVSDLRRQLDPPPGVTANLAGSAALFEATDSDLKPAGRGMTLLALLAAFAVLLAFQGSVSAAAAVLIPLALATGWLQLVLLIVGRPLNPLSATLSALAVAVTTPFAGSAASGYRGARSAGAVPAEAVEQSIDVARDSVGQAIALAIAGLAVLIVSDSQMLRDFGIDSLFGISAVVAGLALVLPATLVLNEEGARVAIRERLVSLRRAAHRAGVKARLGRAFQRRREAPRP